MSAPHARILMFHRVVPDAPAAFGLPDCYRIRGTALTAHELERVLDDAGAVVPLDEVERALERRRGPLGGTVLTFDDGYREHLDLVAPRLARRGLNATFYVSTGLHGAQGAVAIVDAWYWVLDHAESPAATVALPGGEKFRDRLDTYDGKAAWVMGPPKAALLAASPADQRRMLADLMESARCTVPSDLASRLYLRPDEWPALTARGMRVAAHGVRHLRLTRLSDETLEEEVRGSVEAVRAPGAPVAFAYPDGDVDARVMRCARRAGASSAVTCEPGVVTHQAELMRLPRQFVSTPLSRRCTEPASSPAPQPSPGAEAPGCGPGAQARS